MAALGYYDVILKPVLTEKSMNITAEKKYTFYVHPEANKIQIKEAVEKLFEGTKVKKVNTITCRAKTKRRGMTVGKTAKGKKAVVTLTEDTRIVNSRFFDNDPSKVPAQALSVGVATVTDSREVVILAFGPKKARAIKDAVEGPYSHMCTVSALQNHQNGIIVADEASVGELKVNSYKYFKAVEKAEKL